MPMILNKGRLPKSKKPSVKDG